MILSLLVSLSSLAIAETPGMYIAPLLANVEFAMVKPDGCTPENGCISITNTGGTMLALHNDFFPGATQVVDGGSYTTVVYLDRLPVITGWSTSPVTGEPIPVVDGAFISVMLPCVGGARSTVYVDVGGAASVSLSVTPVGYRKTVGLLGVDSVGQKVLAADSAADAQVGIDARTGVIVRYYLGYGIKHQKTPGKAFTVRTSSGVATYAFDRAFGDGQCQP